MHRQREGRIRSRVQLELDGKILLAPDRADLLRAIDDTGSITRAAEKVGLSYKAAWDAVDAIGRRATEPVVIRMTGGVRGGGTRLTAYGRGLLALVRRLEDDQRQTLVRETSLRSVDASTLRTSARNQWSGRIQALHTGRIKAEVRLSLDARHACMAHITAASAAQLGLAPGMRVSALVKASAVAIQPPGRSTGTSMNRLRGVISATSFDDDCGEVTVRVSKACSVVALVRKRKAATLAIGTEVAVTFAPESVLLVVPT